MTDFYDDLRYLGLTRQETRDVAEALQDKLPAVAARARRLAALEDSLHTGEAYGYVLHPPDVAGEP